VSSPPYKNTKNDNSWWQLETKNKNRVLCPRCNETYFIDEKQDLEEAEFHVENKKPHECNVDKCGICSHDLSFLTEKLKIRHIIYCEREVIPTRKGRAMFHGKHF
jgi:hypothetical protein